MANPTVGTVEDGYRFTGGDPARPESWTPVTPIKGMVVDGFRFDGGDPAKPESWSRKGVSGADILSGIPGVGGALTIGRAINPQATDMVADWAATRGVKAATSALGTVPTMARLAAEGPFAALESVSPEAAAYARKGLDATRMVYPDAGDMNAALFGGEGLREANLPGTAGKAVDAAAEALVGLPLMGVPKAGMMIPAALGGAGSELAGHATEGTRAEPFARVAGALAGAGLGAGGQALAKGGYDAARALVAPWTQAGQTGAAGRALREAATDAEKAAAALAESKPTIPGSLPTAAQASNDPGLLALENLFKGQPGQSGAFAVRKAESDAARLAASEGIAGSTTAAQAGDAIREAMAARKAAFEGGRSQAAGPIYDAARVSGGHVIDPSAALRHLDDAMGSAAGAPLAALKTAREAFARPDGTTIRSSVKELEGTVSALDAQIGAARTAGDNNTVRLLTIAKDHLLTAMEAEPLYGMARNAYREASVPLRPYDPKYAPRVAKTLEEGPHGGGYVQDAQTVPAAFLNRGPAGLDEMLNATGGAMAPRKQVASLLMDEFRAKIRTGADAPDGEKLLSAAAADSWWKARKPVAEKVMTPEQVKAMDTLVADFAVGARRQPATAGSPTAQNLAGQNIMQAILRFPLLSQSAAARTTGAVMSKVYAIPEREIQARLMEAMLDPRVAAALMAKASPGNMKLLGPMIEEALTGSAASARPSGGDRRR